MYNPTVPLSCIEFFDPYIIFKQERQSVKLVDVAEETKLVGKNSENFEPESFVFLQKNLIMAMYRDKIEIREHSLKLVDTIKVEEINYFSK